MQYSAVLHIGVGASVGNDLGVGVSTLNSGHCTMYTVHGYGKRHERWRCSSLKCLELM